MYAFDQINESTAFADGEPFTSPEQVRDYFTMQNLSEMFGPHCEEVSQETLNKMADTVISNLWNCLFF